jgi:hypothetical protein
MNKCHDDPYDDDEEGLVDAHSEQPVDRGPEPDLLPIQR